MSEFAMEPERVRIQIDQILASHTFVGINAEGAKRERPNHAVRRAGYQYRSALWHDWVICLVIRNTRSHNTAPVRRRRIGPRPWRALRARTRRKLDTEVVVLTQTVPVNVAGGSIREKLPSDLPAYRNRDGSVSAIDRHTEPTVQHLHLRISAESPEGERLNRMFHNFR